MEQGAYKGYENIKERLGKGILQGNISHAYIIEGDALSRRAEFAMDFAKAIMCKEKPGKGCGICSICKKIDSGNYGEIYRVEAQGNSVKDEQIQNLQSNLMNMPIEEGGRNIAIVDDAETMTLRAQNRFLKTLEEPYPGTVIMLLTGNSDMIIPTIRSRCVKLTLPSEGQQVEEGVMSDAEDLVRMVKNREIYRDITDRLEPYSRNRDKASLLLDALERIMRDQMVRGEKTEMIGMADRGEAYRNVKYIEEARQDLRFNVQTGRALKNLLIKIGGRNEAGSRS